MSPLRDRRPINFDRLARVYRWLEYLSFGPLLQRSRTCLLSDIAGESTTSALVLGDGDGRGVHALLAQHPATAVTLIDLSPAMLTEARRRCDRYSYQITAITGDALQVTRQLAAEIHFDLIVTHFFLDCFDARSLDTLVRNVTARTAPGAQWLLSDFRIPRGWLAIPSRILVRLLYLAFGALTGLRTRSLPDHAQALARAGWIRVRAAHRIGGLLTSELWQRSPAGLAAL